MRVLLRVVVMVAVFGVIGVDHAAAANVQIAQPGVGVTRSDTSRFEIASTDPQTSHVKVSVWNGNETQSVTDLGGIGTSQPDITSWGDQHVDVVVRGADSRIWHRSREADTWSDWERVGDLVAAS